MKFESIEEIVSFATTAKLSEWQTRLFQRYREEIQVHSKGRLFYKIDRLFPNEEPTSKVHRLLSFEPITKGSFNKGISNIMRIFANSSYTAKLNERTHKEINQPKYDEKDLFNYFLEAWMIQALGNDPNSLMVVYPPDYEYADDTVYFISSDDIVYTDEETYIFKSEKESDVKYDVEHATSKYFLEKFYDTEINRFNLKVTLDNFQYDNLYMERINKKYNFTVYHVFTQNKFYRLEQDKTQPDEYTVTSYPLKNMKYPPVRYVGGSRTDDYVFESFLCPFIPFGNLALLQHSQHTAVNFIFSFPRMSEVQSPCDNPLCKGGFVNCGITETCPEGKKPCDKCGGSGYKAPQSPYKIYTPKYDPAGLADNEAIKFPMVQYYTPPVDILKYSKEEWKSYLEMAEMSIYVQQKVQTGNVQSAESKKIDLDELFAFLLRVSRAFYNGLQWVIQCKENYFNAAPMDVVVDRPFSFAILSEEDAFNALQAILLSKAPDLIKGNQVENFILKFVSQSSPVRLAYEVLRLIDPLLLKSDAEIMLLKSNNIITPDMWVTHTFAYPVLMIMFYEDATLFDEKEAQEISVLLLERLKKYKPPPTTELKDKLETEFADRLKAQ